MPRQRRGRALDSARPPLFHAPMSDAPHPPPLPPSIERTLKYFRTLGREEKMQALVSFARKLEPLPPRLAALDRAEFNVPECQTRVDIFPERRDDGTIHFY